MIESNTMMHNNEFGLNPTGLNCLVRYPYFRQLEPVLQYDEEDGQACLPCLCTYSTKLLAVHFAGNQRIPSKYMLGTATR